MPRTTLIAATGRPAALHLQPVRCAQGFGEASNKPSSSPKPTRLSKKQSNSVTRGDAKAVERAVKLVEDRKARPVDSIEASKGRVEFVKVRNWGTGDPGDLGQLEVEAASQVHLDSNAPFYEQLAKRLELLEAQGAMPVAQLKGAKPLPPFKRWAFAESHYLQYLCDLLTVHSALEAALKSCSAACSPEHLTKALELLSPAHGLSRSQQLAADIQRLTADSGAEASSLGSAASPAEAVERDGAASPLPKPSPNAAGHAQYLGALATRVSAAEGEAEVTLSVLKLLAHAYVLLLVLLTSGGRIGAAATEKLDLFKRGALNTYRTYPSHIKDPITTLKEIINEWGELLAQEEKEALMQELPSAMQRTSLLLTPLAQE